MEDFVQNKYGYCYYELSNNSAFIYGLNIDPEYRNRGKAKLILQHVINEIRYSGYTGLIGIKVKPTEPEIDAVRLEKFYIKMGLKIVI